MKKIFIILCCLCLCGCEKKWENKLQISKLKYNDDYIIGEIKNLTNNYYDLIIEIKGKNGDIQEDIMCFEEIKPSEKKDLNCLTNDIDDRYVLKIKNIELKEKEIPSLTEGNIDIDTLKYHFQEIYDLHTLDFTTFVTIANDDDYPYIDEIEYKDSNVKISGTIKQNDNIIGYTETFSTNTSKLDKLIFVSINCEESFLKDFFAIVSHMDSISFDATQSLGIYKTLLRKDIEQDHCVEIGDWCVSSSYNKFGNVFNFFRR